MRWRQPDSDAHANTYADSNADTNTYADANSHSDTNAAARAECAKQSKRNGCVYDSGKPVVD